jgi:hypothetical protein
VPTSAPRHSNLCRHVNYQSPLDICSINVNISLDFRQFPMRPRICITWRSVWSPGCFKLAKIT